MAEVSLGVMFMLVNYSKSQYLTVLSVEPLANARFAGLYSMLVTLWPGKKKLACTLPVLMSHILRAPSAPPDATHLESGDNCTESTAP
jgi:hypothetical protein